MALGPDHRRPAGRRKTLAVDLRRSADARFCTLSASTPWVLRAATILGVAVPVYGLLHLFTGCST
jgi:hypothetical protein